MNLPWMKFHTRDWLDNKELRRCSPAARAILADLMCLAHEGTPYGYLTDNVGPLSNTYMASRCMVTMRVFLRAIEELMLNNRISKDSPICIPRMVADEDLRMRRASGGSESIGHPNTHPPKPKQGYPSDHPPLELDSRARVRADSGSDSVSEFEFKKQGLKRNSGVMDLSGSESNRFPEWWQLWSATRGTPYRDQAARAWLSVVTVAIEQQAIDCTRSYLESGKCDDNHGYNPQNFLAQFAADQFAARWPSKQGKNGRVTVDELAESIEAFGRTK